MLMPSSPTLTLMRKLPRYPIRFLMMGLLVASVFLLNLTRLVGYHREHKAYTLNSRVPRTLDLLPKLDARKGLLTTKFESNNEERLKLDVPRPPAVDSDKLSLEQLRELVAGKNGYYVRDWSVGLGWNNMKYIIEAALIQAKLLNRVLVLPSYLYARNCEYDKWVYLLPILDLSGVSDVCSQYALWVSRENSVGWGEPREEPERNMAWQLPIEIMIDLPKLRSYYPVILTSEFMKLHGLDPSNELLTGHWNQDIHKHPNMASFYVIPNYLFDDDIFRVDTIQPFLSDGESAEIETEVDLVLREVAGEEKNSLSWDTAVQVLRDNGYYYDDDGDEMAEKIINRGGWVVTYTYEALGGIEFAKSVVSSSREIVPRGRVRGWVEDFTMDVDVLLLEGEVHLERKPGSLRFTTSAARNSFTHLVLSYIRPTQPLLDLSERLVRRMTGLAGNTGWFSAHIRRGDFMNEEWVKDESFENHLNYVKQIFDQGREMLAGHVFSSGSGIPSTNVPYFIATDERNKDNLEYMRQDGGITIHDLLTIEDRREADWPLFFTDVLGIVEQRVAASSMFFYGQLMSSLAGGVLNIRMTMGLGSNTWVLD
ncbi:hypothetical protein Clacol_008063 [Clathrus columnatus]|uniref:Peptide-O-fucosyltransferase n=1 Tax=Clathrus columnatus TaxID=1419009 RepID=A0AAV5AN06_9AGAM|nr:hypothetical protein Clacol_008063 [Clathrus columnatus]